MLPDLEQIRPVLLCGGVGSRLAPLSTPEKPKPFLHLISERSMLQETAMRLGMAKPPAVLCHKRHACLVFEELSNVSLSPDIIIKEPESKNTAPAIALAAKYYFERNPEEILLFLPCDHAVSDLHSFQKSLVSAIPQAETGNIVLFGEKPTSVDTGYGYISVDHQDAGEKQIMNVSKFHEKPDFDTARKYVKKGYLWNTGIIMVKADVLAKAYEEFASDIWWIISKISPENIEQKFFSELANISVDYALLERIRNIKVCPVSIGWNDVGTFERLRKNN